MRTETPSGRSMHGIDRRTLLRRAAGTVAAGGALGLLAACGDDDAPAQTGAADAKPSGTVEFSSWGGDYSKAWETALVAPFTAATGIKVVFDDAPGEHIAKLRAQAQTGNVSWNLIEAAFADYFTLVEKDLLQPLPKALAAKLEQISNPGSVTPYGVAVAGAAVQVIASMPSMKRAPTTPAEFWEVEQFPGARGMWKDGFLDNVVSALIADGVPADQLTPLDLDRAFAKLDAIRPHIDVFWASGDQFEQILRDGEVDTAFGWDGRAWKLRDGGTHVTIAYGGAQVQSNYLTVPKDCDNPDAAIAFIEYYATHPKEQAAWTEANLYATSNRRAADHLDKDTAQTLWFSHEDEDLVVLDPNTFDVDLAAVQERWYDWLEG